jgi:hypothetical protein
MSGTSHANSLWKYIISSSLCDSAPFCYFLFLWSKHSLQQSILKHPQDCSVAFRHTSQPYVSDTRPYAISQAASTHHPIIHILGSTLMLSSFYASISRVVSSDFPLKLCIHFASLPCVLHSPFITSSSIELSNNYRRRVQIINFSFTLFLPDYFQFFSLLRWHILVCVLFSVYLHPRSTLNSKHKFHVSTKQQVKSELFMWNRKMKLWREEQQALRDYPH